MPKASLAELKPPGAEVKASRAEVEASGTEVKPPAAELFALRPELKASAAKLKPSRAKLKASRAELQAPRPKLKPSRAELQASRPEVKASPAKPPDLRFQTDHEFWPDTVSICDGKTVDTKYLHSPCRLTDNYPQSLILECSRAHSPSDHIAVGESEFTPRVRIDCKSIERFR
jgi:hypothetical protein